MTKILTAVLAAAFVVTIGSPISLAQPPAPKPWVPDSFWFQDAAQQKQFQDPACENDFKCVVLRDRLEIEVLGLQKEPVRKSVGADKVSVHIRLATFKKRQQDFTTDLTQAGNRIMDALSKAINTVLTPQSGVDVNVVAQAREIFDGFSSTNPLNVLLSSTKRRDFPAEGPATTWSFVDLADVGNSRKRKPVVRFTVEYLLGKGDTPRQTDDGLGAVMAHELVHVLLQRRDLDTDAVWTQVRSKLNIKGPKAAQEAAERLAFLYIRAQEEIFAHRFVGSLRNNPFTEGAALYALWNKSVRQCFEIRGASFDTLKKSIKVSRKVKNTAVNWDIAFEFPSNFTVKDGDENELNAEIKRRPEELLGM